jgi:adenine-specific DNA-methyltransferase
MKIDEIETWRRGLGLFPVPLHHDSEEGPRFVLLNGARGSFCLDLSGADPDPRDARSIAWSSNVGHYVALTGDSVVVQPWDQRPGRVDRYTYASVAQQLDEFHSYLEKTTPDTSTSVVSHGLRAFRGLRTALGGDIKGTQALKAFLLFLACAHERTGYESIDLIRWELEEEACSVAKHAKAQEWAILLEEFAGGRRNEALELRIDLLLRHASGFMFQEAHYQALVAESGQMQFDFLAPEPARIRRTADSSGLHFTPPALSRTLVEESLRYLDTRTDRRLAVFDPACGSGEFLREVLRQLRLQKYSGHLRLIGWDISDAACAMARFALAWDLRSEPRNVQVEIRRCDSLADPEIWPDNIDLLLMNPPFVSWQNLSPAQEDSLARTLGPKLKYRPDLSAGFLFKAAHAVKSGGILGSVLPSSFLSAESAEPIREYVGGVLQSKLIARLGSHTLFPGAVVDAALYIAVAGAQNGEPPLAVWSDYRPDSAFASLRELRKARSADSRLVYPIKSSGYSLYHNPEIGTGGESWAPRPYESWVLLKSLADLPRIRQFFRVHQGSRTGHKSALVLAKHDWSSLPKNERRFFRPAVLNGSIADGVLSDLAYAFFPYGEQEISTEAELLRSLPTYFERFLAPHLAALKTRTRVKSEKWWALSERRKWQEQKRPKIVSAYFGESGAFAWDGTGRFIVVQGFGWLPTEDAEPAVSPKVALAYLALFNSRLFWRLLSATSNHVGGGQWDLSPRFVNEIPIPWLGASLGASSSSMDGDLLADLCQLGEEIDRRSLQSLTQSEKDRLEQAVEAAYGLPHGDF